MKFNKNKYRNRGRKNLQPNLIKKDMEWIWDNFEMTIIRICYIAVNN